MKRRHWVTPLVVLASLGFPLKAIAHVMETNYFLAPDKSLQIEAVYSTGEPAQQAAIAIYSPNNPSQPIAEGVTDAQGRFNFTPDPAIQGEWTVRIGEKDHSDILSVPVDNNGIEVDRISAAPVDGLHPDAILFTVGAIAVLGGYGAATALSRRKA